MSKSKLEGGFIITADWHVHCWRDGGEPVSGINGRLKDFLFAFQDMMGYAREHKIKKVFVLGDVFHLKKNIPVQAYDQLFMYLWAVRDVEWEFLAGNHDREDDRYDSVTILPFKQIGSVWTQPEVDKKNSMVIVPWEYDQTRVVKFMKGLGKKEFDLLLFHGEMEGALMGPTDYAMKSKVTEKSFGLERFGQKYAGHIHKQQRIKGVWYPGSLIAKDFGEIESDKGFLHVVGDAVHRVSVRYPKFVTITQSPQPDEFPRIAKEMITGNFVQVITEQPVDPSIVKKLEQANPRTLRFKLGREQRETQSKPAPMTDQSWDGMVTSYVERKGTPPELMDEYVDYGLKVLRGA